ncbi:MAG: BlaI/MecI/CopY family transcriptional regulator [Xanthomonadales bacterium]|nr:BlaI/MecI/CopY family transcriptional regulator [Xanthomonadales bacterium]
MTITDAEMRIMQTLWASSPLTAADIATAVGEETGWRAGTIKALLNRMLNKGVVSARKDGRRYLYSPAVKRKDCLIRATSEFLDRWFDGHLTPFVAHLSHARQLERREIEELRKLIEEIEDDD